MNVTRTQVREVLEAHWVPEGYCAPHPDRYPWQWLWDSCFTSVVWAELGDERALDELRTCFRWQHGDGFVPHMGYQRGPEAARRVWGRPGASTLTQPPMFGHAAAELARRGLPVDDELLERMRRAFAFLLARRRTPEGLVRICHPWESGADDTPRWDHWRPAARSDRSAWLERKLQLLREAQLSADGALVDNPAFSVAAASFNALVAFNLRELADLAGDSALAREGQALAEAAEDLWDEDRSTWVDRTASLRVGSDTTAARTLDGLLMVLVSGRRERVERAFAQVVDERAFGGWFGPASVHREEPTFDPGAYGRGSAWPHLTYLLWVAARRQGLPEAARWLGERLVRGAAQSGLAEHWHPDLGQALGTVPHSWATVAVLVGGRSSPAAGGPTSVSRLPGTTAPRGGRGPG